MMREPKSFFTICTYLRVYRTFISYIQSVHVLCMRTYVKVVRYLREVSASFSYLWAPIYTYIRICMTKEFVVVPFFFFVEFSASLSLHNRAVYSAPTAQRPPFLGVRGGEGSIKGTENMGCDLGRIAAAFQVRGIFAGHLELPTDRICFVPTYHFASHTQCARWRRRASHP